MADDQTTTGSPCAARKPTWRERLLWRYRRWSFERCCEWAAQRMCRFILWHSKSNYLSHARREFVIAGYDPDDTSGPNRWIQDDVLTLLAVLGLQGHSGGSIGYCLKVFHELAQFHPMTPLTGDESEWQEVCAGTWQNTRCSHVFKEADGRAYDIEGRIFREPSGSCFTNRDSRVFVEFPYLPKREYVDVA